MQIFHNYWTRLSVIWKIIKTEVVLSAEAVARRQVTQTEAFIIFDITRKPNSIIIILRY
jgi:hypothetical protein